MPYSFIGDVHSPTLCLWQVGAVIVESACVIEMPDLKGREKLGSVPLYAQIEKPGQ